MACFIRADEVRSTANTGRWRYDRQPATNLLGDKLKSLIDRLSCNFVKQREFSLLTSETDGLKFDRLSLVLLVFG